MHARRSMLLPLMAITLTLCLTGRAAGARPAPAMPASPAPGQAVTSPTAKSDPYAEFVGKKFSRGLHTKKRVALTFDDGPHPKLTPQVIEILKKEGVKATFFMLGGMLSQNPSVGKAVADAGFEIGDHSMTHANLNRGNAETVWTEIDGPNKLIEQVCGHPTRLFRPPYGNVSRNVVQAAVKEGMVLCLWAVDTNDWKPGATPAKIVQTVMSQVKPGDVILMHDIHAKTVQALPEMIQELKKQGYELVTVGQLIEDYAAAPPEQRNEQPSGGATYGGGAEPATPAPPLAISLQDSAKY